MRRAILLLALLCATASAQVTGISPGMWKSGAAPAWRPSSLDSLYVDAQVDSIVGKAHGDTVAIWPNNWKAGNFFNTASTRPIYRTNEINGKPVLHFNNASTQFMQSKDNALGYKTGISIFVVAKYKSTDDNKALLAVSSVGYSGGDDWVLFRTLSGARNFTVNPGGSAVTAGVGVPDTNAHVFVGLFAASDSVIQWIDGSRSAAPFAGTKLDLRANIDVAFIDNNGSPLIHANVYIARIIIYGGRKSNADVKLVRDYLKAEYATP